MFPTGPIYVVAESVDILEVERLGRGVDGTELGIAVAAAPIHVDDACRKTRHEGGTQTIVGQPDVSNTRGAESAAEGKPRSVNYRRRENVILGQSNPLDSCGHHETEERVVSLRLILKRIVNRIAAKYRVCGGKIVVHTHLTVIFYEAVMVAAGLNRPKINRSV